MPETALTVISTKPYLIRAIYEWSLDNQLTPQIMVSDSVQGVVIPQDYVKDGHIVFNIHENAVKDLNMDNEWILFSARFAGKAMQVQVPIEAVLAIYARENGQGIFFQDDNEPPPSDEDKNDQPKSPKFPDGDTGKSPKSHLKLVK